MQQRLSRSNRARSGDRLSIIVDRLAARTAAPHGITGPELERLSGAVRFMTLHCRPRRSALWLATTNKGAARPAIADVWKRITRLQTKYDLPAYSVAVLETRGGLHAHIAFIGTRDIAGRLQSSSAFGELIDVRPVTDSNGLVRKYLSKERTSQAGYGREHLLGGRLKGAHRLEGGGDRVRLSRALERDAIEAGYVDAWQHSNARRSFERRRHQPRALTRKAPCTELSPLSQSGTRSLRTPINHKGYLMTEFVETAMRSMCRNPRCRSKLPSPVSNPRDAFCTRGCHMAFYRKRCLVCECAIEQPKRGQRLRFARNLDVMQLLEDSKPLAAITLPARSKSTLKSQQNQA